MINAPILLGLISLILALAAVLTAKNLYALVYLFLFFFSIGIIYIELSYPFLGIAQILLYGGGVITLLLFALPFDLSLNNAFQESKTPTLFQHRWFFIGLFLLTCVLITYTLFPYINWDLEPISNSPISFNELLFSKYALLLEFISLLLLVVLVALSAALRKGGKIA
jgi:NADH:ubiquinone oxidoreductase subunit 6 (subunit J)